ncbi:MAG: N-acetyltransferase family protein [Bacteroidia bacterium]|nr:N-acetyltransferase family protein [Bacteroidia bacterium]
MKIQLRKMTATDWPRVKDIYQKGLDLGYASFETEAPAWEKWDATHLTDCRYVAETSEGILGWIALSKVSAREVYKGVAEVSIYIDPAQSGRGLGKKLMEKVIEESEKRGFWTLQSGIFPQNTASIHLHEKMGFRKIGYREKVAKRVGIWQDNVLMERRSKKVGLD